MKKLYCFDFDGTLTHRDTMFLFLNFYNSKKFKINFLKYTPLFVLLKLKLLDPERIKKSFIAAVLKGDSKIRIEKKSRQFYDKYAEELFRENALEFIKTINRETTTALIITASLDIWVQPFAEAFDMKLLATRADFENGVFTGKFLSKNCNGPEKVERIKAEIGGQKFDKTVAFGDTLGDREMLSWADEGHYKFFH